MTPKDTQRVLDATPEEIAAGGKDYGVLKRFMKEHFSYSYFRKIGVFAKDDKNDYYKQAVKLCHWFSYKSIFEYGSQSFSCHITYLEGKRPDGTPFIEHFKSIYE